MAKLICTLKEFTYFIDPRIKNNIANMTRSAKRKQGSKCQECGEKKELDAAHIPRSISLCNFSKQIAIFFDQ